MFKRHPIVTVIVALSLLYMMVTAPLVVFGAFGELAQLGGKALDSIVLALSQLG